ncbi:MAG: hypothetical protein OEV94_04560 [Deltaproteobacteria bacterium]|nr:hypothetical protein [Deltaproteobacteria bacterium]
MNQTDIQTLLNDAGDQLQQAIRSRFPGQNPPAAIQMVYENLCLDISLLKGLLEEKDHS